MNPGDRSGWRASFAGIVAVAAALATGELAAGIIPGVPSPLLAVAQFFVDIQPAGAKDLMVGLFGTNDKIAFQAFIVVVALLIGAGVGRLAQTRQELAGGVIAAFAAAGFAASMRDPDATLTTAAVASAIQAVVGIWVLGRLMDLAMGRRRTASHATPAGGMPDWTRRALLRWGGGIAVASVAAATVGRWLLERQAAPVAAANIPTPSKTVALPPGADISTADLTAAGLTPIVMPNDRFYRIDTAFAIPVVDRDTWSLKVTGLVDHEVTLSYAELAQLPIVEQFVTIACVSNEVGGNLVGNAKWTGVELRKVLAMAGVQASADQLVGVSVDGFTAGMPVEWVMDTSRTPMIAFAMNDEPLPRAHGFPARLIVPGLYGYVSATKWLSELRLTRFEDFQAFWVPRGWAPQAPILTQSRIDVPHDGVKAGRVPVAGVAWAPDRGISRVEVRIDDGDWLPATLSAAISKATWVQWLYLWDATPGSHTIEVRATDGTGVVQTDEQTPPPPDGARGHHRIAVRVS